MRELYNRSEGEGDDFAHSTVENVTAWWTSVIVGLLILSAMIVKFALDAATNLIIMTPIWMEFVILTFFAIAWWTKGRFDFWKNSAIGDHFDIIAGVRYDRFEIDVIDALEVADGAKHLAVGSDADSSGYSRHGRPSLATESVAGRLRSGIGYWPPGRGSC